METRTIIFSVTCFGLGVGAGFIFAKKKYEKMCAEEVEAMREAYKRKEEAGESATEKLNSIKNYISEHYAKTSEDIEFVREEPEEDSEDVSEDCTDDEFEQERAENEAPVEPDIKDTPYPISAEEYFEGSDAGIGKKALIYYAGNDTLISEDDEEVMDISIIGLEENRAYFGQYEDNRLFIRNEALGEDYEVIFEDASYTPNEEG